jgi:hypothetical protein
MTTAYGNLSLYHSRHEYKRGAYKGDAPADSSRRAKAHFRIVKPDPAYPTDPYKVRFWATNILTAYPDGRVKINCNGFDDRPTTRGAMNHALHICGFRGHMFSRRLGALSQTAISINGKSYRYYDGMEFDAEGTLLTPPQAWEAVITDTDKTKAFRAQTKEFWAMFPVLFATRSNDHAFRTRIFDILHAANGFVGAPAASILDNPEHWPVIVSYYTSSYDDDQPKQARAHLMQLFTQHMTKLVDRGVE